MATANVSWTAPGGGVATGYKVEYKKASTGTWTLFAANHQTTSCTIGNLDAATSYDFRITTKCSVGDASPVIYTAMTPCSPTGVGEIYLIQDATENTPGDTRVAANRRNVVYGEFGTRIYRLGNFAVDGTATGPTMDITSASYFMNNINGTTLDGRLNNVGIWGADECASPTFETLGNEFIGFVRTINIPTSGTYYIAVGADNRIKVTIDGNVFVENTTSVSEHFKWWNVYPVNMSAGVHILGFYGWDDGSVSAAFGAEIYNNNESQIVAATGTADLDIIYSTETEFCQPFDQGQTVGYSCPAGWTLDTSTNPPKCVKLNTPC